MSSDDLTSDARQFIVSEDHAGTRLDQFLSRQFEEFSRSHLRRIIDAGGVTIDGKNRKPSFSLTGGECIRVDPIYPVREGPKPENIPLEFLYEDEVLAVVNKRPGMVVHPGRGNWTGTLAGALAFHFDQLSTSAGIIRPGIVHRLDRDTSGVLVIAKTDPTHAALADQFKARTVEKEYLAIVIGSPDRDRDWIDGPIGDHPRQREKKAIRANHASSRPARTFYEVVERFHVGSSLTGRTPTAAKTSHKVVDPLKSYALVKALPKTGRTHQIRLHMTSIGCPILCDRLYGGRAEICLDELLASGRREPSGSESTDSPTILLARQALHAHRLAFDHPTTGERREFIAPLPGDMAATLSALRSTQE